MPNDITYAKHWMLQFSTNPNSSVHFLHPLWKCFFFAWNYTCLQKYLNTCQRDEDTEMSCIFGSIFKFFLTTQGEPPSRSYSFPCGSATTHLLPPWQQVPFWGVQKYLNTFSCCCNFLNIAATWTVFTLLESLKSQQLNLLHSFSEKLHIKGSTGHFVNAVNLSTVQNGIMPSSINIEATQTLLTSLESFLKTAVELSTLLWMKLHIKGSTSKKAKKHYICSLLHYRASVQILFWR